MHFLLGSRLCWFRRHLTFVFKRVANMTDLTVSRYCKYISEFRPRSGYYLSVGGVELGEFQDIVQAEYKRAGTAYDMRPMFYTGSPFGAEILELARKVRGDV